MNLEELKKLAQAATQGAWYDDSEWSPDDVSIWSGRPRDPDASFVGNIGGERFVEVGVAFDVDTNNGRYISAANPSTILELIERCEKAEARATVTDNSSTLYAALERNTELETELNELKKSSTAWGHTYHDSMIAAEKERDELRAKIAEMEKQTPVAEVAVSLKTADLCAHLNGRGYNTLKSGDKLYALPVPVPQQSEWQPIETAPTDGKRFDIFYDGFERICDCYFDDVRLMSEYDCKIPYRIIEQHLAAHWMPKPLPPITK